MKSSALPTTDLYFLNSCRQWIGRWPRQGPIERLGANLFRRGDRLVLIRKDEARLLDMAIQWPGTLTYVIDDDIDGAAQSSRLPRGYREKLATFARRYLDPLLRRADLIVTSSETLRKMLCADARVTNPVCKIDPFWNLPFADQSHFDAAAQCKIVHLGSGSHAAGLADVTGGIIEALNHFPRSRFTFFGRRGEHRALDAHPQASRIQPMSWPQYQRWLQCQRFHLALYPLDSTPFDRARSCNKVLEHAIVGAVGIYHKNWLLSRLQHDAAVLAPDDPLDWSPVLLDTIAHWEQQKGRAKHAAIALNSLQNPAIQQEFWAKNLGLTDLAIADLGTTAR